MTQKALIRKYPDNALTPDNNEVWYYPWHGGNEDGTPYTLEGYRYALCEDAPDPVYDEAGQMTSPTVDDFTVTANTIEEIDETGEVRTRTYWTATYTGGTQ